MRTHDYLLGLSLLALVACNQENMPERPTPTPGAEVKFGVSLNKTDVTRTIYGKENNNAFPIYWVQDDKVLVTSPQCLNGRNTAQYKVSVKTDKQNYASSLDKTGAAGVQWGQDDTADFYSVYPADNASVQGTTFSLTMPNVQRDVLKLGGKKDVKAYADMSACFMGAVSKDVPNGSDVHLTYKPLSTAIRFTLHGPSAAEGQTDSEVIISKVVLKADQPIAGDFTVDMSNVDMSKETPTATVTPGGKTYNEITLYTYYASTGGYLTLGLNDEVELNAFVIPHENLAVNDNWKLEVTTAQGKVYTTSLKGSGVGKLMPGRIHRFLGKLPNLPAPTTDWDPSNWMVNVPRNVYLSEISIPGSWNSLNKEFQYAADGSSKLDVNSVEKQKAAIIAQYNAGVRAFHIDTRWKAPWASPVTGLSVANGADTWDKSSIGAYKGGKVMRDGNITFATVLNCITSQVKPKEYMMVFCTFAQNSYEKTEGEWMKAISDVCAKDPNVIDVSKISANTVVGDVLGKVIVIVNCHKDPSTIKNLPHGSSKCLFTYTPITLNEGNFHDLRYCEGNIVNSASPTLKMYSSQAQTMATLDAKSGFTDRDRGYCPTLAERMEKSQNILNFSNENFGKTNYEHAHWMYHGLGGYSIDEKTGDHLTNQKEVAEKLNRWIDSKMKLMAAKPTGDQTRYYPVGLVLMNYVTDKIYGVPVVKGILSHNNKFRKAYNPGKDPLDPSNNGSSSDVNSAAPGYNSGMKDNGTDAIGWTRSH